MSEMVAEKTDLSLKRSGGYESVALLNGGSSLGSELAPYVPYYVWVMEARIVIFLTSDWQDLHQARDKLLLSRADRK